MAQGLVEIWSSAAQATMASSKSGSSAAEPVNHFRAYYRNEIPAEWLVPPSPQMLEGAAEKMSTNTRKVAPKDIEWHVAIATPDFPMFWTYEAWLQTQNYIDLVGIIVKNRKDFDREGTSFTPLVRVL